jgi:hypothetical protein
MVNETTPPAAKKINFPGKDPGEEFRFYFMQHWIRVAHLLGFFILWMLILAAAIYASDPANIQDESTRRAVIVTLCIFFFVPQVIFLTRLYKYFLYIIVVTDKKVHLFKRTLIMVDRHESVDLWVLQDINTIQRGIFQNLLGFGSLALAANDSHLTIHFTPHIHDIYHKIVQLREIARTKTLPPAVQQRIKEELDKNNAKTASTQQSAPAAEQKGQPVPAQARMGI